MSRLEGRRASVAQDKGSIVIDIGTVYTKYGITTCTILKVYVSIALTGLAWDHPQTNLSPVCYCRCGMSGEAAPRHIIRSQVTMKPYGQVCTQPSGRGKVGGGGWGNTRDTGTNWGWCRWLLVPGI